MVLDTGALEPASVWAPAPGLLGGNSGTGQGAVTSTSACPWWGFGCRSELAGDVGREGGIFPCHSFAGSLQAMTLLLSPRGL